MTHSGLLLATGAVFAGVIVIGCAGPHATPGAQRINLAEFANRAPARATAPRSACAGELAGSPLAMMPLRAVSTPEMEERADRAAAARLRPGDRFVVDSLVGQVNGRPIFADAFFAPIEDQLIQVRRRTTERQFTIEAHDIIAAHLWQHVRDELFLAQAEASLSPEERQGLFAFMRYMREREIALGGGTRAGAEQRIQALEGVTLDDYVRGRLDRELVTKLLHEKILPRVIVSWRDVQREYRRRYAEFNPPAVVHIGRIRLDNEEAEKIEHVRASLAAGEAFAQVARSVGQGDGSWQTFTVGEGGVHDIQLADALKARLSGLEIGETAGPIRLSSATMWLHLSRIEQPEGRSLFDLEVQRALRRELYSRRLAEEEHRYINALFQQGVKEELNVMTLRLLEIALQRYGGPAS